MDPDNGHPPGRRLARGADFGARPPVSVAVRAQKDALDVLAAQYAYSVLTGRALREASPTVYWPWRQFPTTAGYFAVRSSLNAGGTTAAIRRTLKEVDPTLALWDVRSMDERLGGPLAEPRLSALLLVAFGAVALLLAAVGLYGVMASAVREQTREIGIRVALGATPALIRGSVLRRAFLVAGAGACVGLGGALATTRLLQSLLFQVSPTDPLTLILVCLVLLAVAGIAASVCRKGARAGASRAA